MSDVPNRFADLADLLEQAGHYERVGFMRASAERYRKVLGLPVTVTGATNDR